MELLRWYRAFPCHRLTGELAWLCDAVPCGNPIEAALLPPLGDYGKLESI